MEKTPFFSVILDDFQDYIYEGFGALLNKSRSANVGVIFSHQALGDLDKVSNAFRNIVLTNTNIKIIMRMNDPETCDHFAKTFRTKTITKVTQKTKDGGVTGDGSARDVEQFNFHPNVFKKLGTGHGVMSIPHRDGVKNIRVKFSMHNRFPIFELPQVTKQIRPVAFIANRAPPKREQQETEIPQGPGNAAQPPK